jgi:hypothetical protein
MLYLSNYEFSRFAEIDEVRPIVEKLKPDLLVSLPARLFPERHANYLSVK